MAWKTVAKTIEFVDVSSRGFIVEDRPIMISKLDGRFYAIDAICPHKFGYLPMGSRNGDCITCPAHFAEFDLRTGKMTKGRVSHASPDSLIEVEDLKSYEVVVEGEEIKIKI